MAQRCVITGAGGYVGSSFMQFLRQKGWDTVGLSHRSGNPKERFNLNEEPSPSLFQGAQALIHCAYDFRAATWADIKKTNVEGSLRLFHTARKSGVKTLVFISSMSAFDGCVSKYGKAKREVEKEVIQIGVHVVRPGTIYGPRPQGLFGKIAGLIKISPVIPVVGGTQRLYMVHEEDVLNFVYGIMEGRIPFNEKPWNLAYPTAVSFKDILRTIAESQKKAPVFLPVPCLPVWMALKIMEAVGLRPRLRSDSLVGLFNTNPHPEFNFPPGFTLQGFTLKDVSG